MTYHYTSNVVTNYENRVTITTKDKVTDKEIIEKDEASKDVIENLVVIPTTTPTIIPSNTPIVVPSTILPAIPQPVTPSVIPTATPQVTIKPILSPSISPSIEATIVPTTNITIEPTINPTVVPTKPPIIITPPKPGILPDKIQIDDVDIDEDDYTIEDDKLIIKPSVYEDLEDGKYIIRFEYGNEVFEDELIIDNGTPEVASFSAWSLFDLAMTVLTVLMMIVFFVITRKKENIDINDKIDQEKLEKIIEDDEKQIRERKIVFRILSILIVIITVILLCITQDFTLPMIIFDEWSLYFAILAMMDILLFIVFYIYIKKTSEEEIIEKLNS